MQVTCDLPRLPPACQENTVPERDDLSRDQRVEEATAEAADVPALEVLPHLYGRDPQRRARFQRDMQTNANFLLRGRAGAIVSTVLGQNTRDALALLVRLASPGSPTGAAS